jgi:spore coat protein U-like protein
MSSSVRVILTTLLGLAAPAAFAQTITINANVANQCNVASATVNFGVLNALATTTIVNTTSNLVVSCNHGAALVLRLNNGANAAGNQKRMLRTTAPARRINYNISRPNLPLVAGVNTCSAVLPGTEWRAAFPVTATPMFAASGGPRLIPICASIPGSQFPPSGIYQDTVVVTATVS